MALPSLNRDPTASSARPNMHYLVLLARERRVEHLRRQQRHGSGTTTNVILNCEPWLLWTVTAYASSSHSPRSLSPLSWSSQNVYCRPGWEENSTVCPLGALPRFPAAFTIRPISPFATLPLTEPVAGSSER